MRGAASRLFQRVCPAGAGAGAGTSSRGATGGAPEAHEQNEGVAQSSDWQSFMVAAAQGLPRWHPTLALVWAQQPRQQQALYYGTAGCSAPRPAALGHVYYTDWCLGARVDQGRQATGPSQGSLGVLS